MEVWLKPGVVETTKDSKTTVVRFDVKETVKGGGKAEGGSR